jgi:hypothetical protein
MRNAAAKVVFTLADEEAAALAAFLRRAGYSDFRECAESNAEAYLVLQAASHLREVLNHRGYG